MFGYNKWFNEQELILRDSPEEEHLAVYRGWMMKSDQYKRFYDQLLDKNIRLITNPEQYRLMHIFPYVYESVKADTARIQVYPLHTHINVEQLKQLFGRFIVKDYVKSVKGTGFPQFFDCRVSQEDFDRWMEIFYKYRGELLTGGICIKEYLDLKYYGEQTNEYRVFYINHEIAFIYRNSGQGDYTPEPPQELIRKYGNLGSLYYTIDYVELWDGSWKIVETGDGGVSGLSANEDYEQYFRMLYQHFK